MDRDSSSLIKTVRAWTLIHGDSSKRLLSRLPPFLIRLFTLGLHTILRKLNGCLCGYKCLAGRYRWMRKYELMEGRAVGLSWLAKMCKLTPSSPSLGTWVTPPCAHPCSPPCSGEQVSVSPKAHPSGALKPLAAVLATILESQIRTHFYRN
jgi:hypothetical protein